MWLVWSNLEAAQWTRSEGRLDLIEQPGHRVFRLRWPTDHMKMIFTLMLPNAIEIEPT